MIDNPYKVLYRGKVTRIATDGVRVEVPALGVGQEFGPCETSPIPVVSGDRVLVGQIEGVAEELVIIATLLSNGNPGGAGILFFATTAARDTAIPLPIEGQWSFVDADDVLYVYSDGVWKNYATLNAPASYPPTAHAATHQPGGSDAMAVDAAAATGSLRTIGAGALQASSGTHAHSDVAVALEDTKVLVLMGVL